MRLWLMIPCYRSSTCSRQYPNRGRYALNSWSRCRNDGSSVRPLCCYCGVSAQEWSKSRSRALGHLGAIPTPPPETHPRCPAYLLRFPHSFSVSGAPILYDNAGKWPSSKSQPRNQAHRRPCRSTRQPCSPRSRATWWRCARTWRPSESISVTSPKRYARPRRG